MKSNDKKQIKLVLLLTLAIPHAVPHYLQVRPNRTNWTKSGQIPVENNFEEVSLVQPKFKSKILAGLDVVSNSKPESSSGQTRHLEWFSSSNDDSESAPATEKGFISDFFDDEDEDVKAPAKDALSNGLLRQNQRKKYVKVDKVLLPLLLAYKLKFFTMVPLLIGALTLVVGTTGLAGFFFALFAAAAGLHHHKGHHG